jgi:hypothetical protein
MQAFPRGAWEREGYVLVPTLRVGMPARTLRVLQSDDNIYR